MFNEQNGGKKYIERTRRRRHKNWEEVENEERNYEEQAAEEEEEEDVCLQHAVFFWVHIDNNVLAVSRTLVQLKSNSTIAIFHFLRF